MSWRSRSIVPAVLAIVAAVLASVTGCTSVSTVRVQSENVYAGAHLRPIAIVHAQVTSAYILFIPIPGHVDLDQVVNRMLITAAKTLGADKVVDIKVDITPEDGIWTLRKLLGWRTAEASGTAVVVEDEHPAAAAPDPKATGTPVESPPPAK